MTGWHGDALIVAIIWQNLAKNANNCQKMPKLTKKLPKVAQKRFAKGCQKVVKNCQKLPRVA